jgi:hypothetical protein
VKKRRRFSLVVAAVIAVWLAAVVVTPRPVNPVIDSALGLEATASVPPDVLAMLRTSCFDCHSDETRWPWYTRAFPASWLVSHDVEEGRGQLNLSRWSEYNVFDRADLLDEMCEHATTGEMPLWQYTLMHRDARLSAPQIETLCAWTAAELERLLESPE